MATTLAPFEAVKTQRESAQEPHPLRWTKAQYHRMGAIGWFEDKRVELIEGEIIEMAAMNHPHWVAVTLVSAALRRIFEPTYLVITQLPINAGKMSEPEPDVAVVPGQARDYVRGHPTTVLLAVEISDTTLQFDRIRKMKLYAKAGVQEYWILNLKEKQLEVFRQPVMKRATYKEVTTVAAQGRIMPLAAPTSEIAVADLLP